MSAAILPSCGPFETLVSIDNCITISFHIHLIHMKGQIEWISDALLPVIRNVPRTVALEIRLFVTGVKKREDRDVEFKARTEGSNKSILRILTSPVVRLQSGRPDLHGLLKDKIARAGGDISVNGMIFLIIGVECH
jgi:ferric-chelate reductase